VLFDGKQWGATILRRKPQSADVEYNATSSTAASFENNIELDRITLVAHPSGAQPTKVTPKKRKSAKAAGQRGGHAVREKASGTKRHKAAAAEPKPSAAAAKQPKAAASAAAKTKKTTTATTKANAAPNDKACTEEGVVTRPRGRAPKGMQWDYGSGAWIEAAARPRGRAPKGMQWDYGSGAWIEAAAEASSSKTKTPKAKAKAAPNAEACTEEGVVTRPRGRAPRGMQWDYGSGAWIEAAAEASSSKKKPSAAAAKQPKAAASAAAKTKTTTTATTKAKAAANAPACTEEGFVTRPTGRAPKGMQWDYGSGAWIEAAAEASSSKTPSAKRPASTSY
jgi:hypothetical protein